MTVIAHEQQSVEGFDDHSEQVEEATAKSLAFLRLLLQERTDDFDADALPTDQPTVSALIDELRQRPALPATEDQIARVERAAGSLGIHVDTDNLDRARANRILLDLRARLRTEAWSTTQARARDLANELVGR